MKSTTLFILLCACMVSPCLAQQMQLSATNPVSMAKLNTPELDEAAPFLTFNGKRIYFIRANDEQADILHEIWYADLMSNGQLSVIKAPKPLNAGLNSAVVGFNQAGNTIYLFGTYNKLFENQKGLSYAKLENEKWSKPRKIDIPGLDIEGGFYGLYMHPSENVLLISKGSTGNEDLFVSVKDPQAGWSKPVSLGPQINSEGFEISPFLTHDKKHLFFSRGAEGTDTNIFHTERLDETWEKWSSPQKLAEPINSDGFDAYFSMLPDSTIVFSSDRAGSSDVYLAKLQLKSGTQNPKLKEPKPLAVNYKKNLGSAARNKKEAPGSYVFFDFNHFQIPANQEPTLNEIIWMMQDNPDMKIKLTGHTDDVDTEEFNQGLSEKRAKEVWHYFVRKGVAQERITLASRGELIPIANNEHERGRALNRRVEIGWQ